MMNDDFLKMGGKTGTGSNAENENNISRRAPEVFVEINGEKFSYGGIIAGKGVIIFDEPSENNADPTLMNQFLANLDELLGHPEEYKGVLPVTAKAITQLGPEVVRIGAGVRVHERLTVRTKPPKSGLFRFF